METIFRISWKSDHRFRLFLLAVFLARKFFQQKKSERLATFFSKMTFCGEKRVFIKGTSCGPRTAVKRGFWFCIWGQNGDCLKRKFFKKVVVKFRLFLLAVFLARKFFQQKKSERLATFFSKMTFCGEKRVFIKGTSCGPRTAVKRGFWFCIWGQNGDCLKRKFFKKVVVKFRLFLLAVFFGAKIFSTKKV